MSPKYAFELQNKDGDILTHTKMSESEANSLNDMARMDGSDLVWMLCGCGQY